MIQKSTLENHLSFKLSYISPYKVQKLDKTHYHKSTYRAQNKHLKLVGCLFNYKHYYRLSMAFPLEMYNKFVLPNWRLLGHILKWVRKWHVTDHYFELCLFTLYHEALDMYHWTIFMASIVWRHPTVPWIFWPMIIYVGPSKVSRL